jgi:hypothetical protein
MPLCRGGDGRGLPAQLRTEVLKTDTGVAGLGIEPKIIKSAIEKRPALCNTMKTRAFWDRILNSTPTAPTILTAANSLATA